MAGSAHELAENGQIPARMSPESRLIARNRSDRALAEHARPQHGVLTIGQLAALGLSPRATRDRAAAGRLLRLHTGVYATGAVTDYGRWMAAVLACGAGAVLSHRSAAALWGFADPSWRTDLMVPGRAGRTRPGIDVHRANGLDQQSVTRHEGIPCTDPARTLLDFAAVAERRELERVVDRAETLRRFDLKALRSLLERNPRHRGARKLTAILAAYGPSKVTRSEAEERMLELIVAAALPRPRVNAWIALDDNTGYEADFLWADLRLVVEVDSRAYHARRRAFDHDRQRDRRLALAGYETRRYAVAELGSHPERVIAELHAFLKPR
jgi:very-short-patch-repair endonuclease